MRRTATLLFVVSLLTLAFAAPASADLGERLVGDFSDDGVLDPCKYSEKELGLIKGLIANDIDEYAPDLRSAIDAMLEQRAQGACNKNKQPSGSGGATAGGSGTGAGGSGSGGTSGTGSTGGSATSAPGVAKQAPAPAALQGPSPLLSADAIPAAARTVEDGETPPFPLLALAALLALMALGTIAYGVLRFTGWEPAWAPRARHAAAEAGWRASSTWAEFTDFVRFGR